MIKKNITFTKKLSELTVQEYHALYYKNIQLAKNILNAIYQLAEVIKAMIHGLFYLILNLIKQSVNIHIVLVLLKCFLNLKNPMVSIYKKLELEIYMHLKIYTALFVLLGLGLVFLQLTILKIMLMLKNILILDMLKITKMVNLFAYYLYLI